MSFHLNETTDSEHLIGCLRCLIQTRHVVLASVLERTHPGDDRVFKLHEIVRCEGCHTVSFRKEVHDAEVFSPDGSVLKIIHSLAFFPIRRSGKGKLRGAFLLSPNLQQIYHETWIALSNDQPILTGTGIRVLIEAVCKHKKASGPNLESKIDDLVNNGVLAKDGAKILHALRVMGNQAAHEVEPHSRQTLEIAMDVVENLLINVFILPVRTRTLTKNRKR